MSSHLDPLLSYIKRVFPLSYKEITEKNLINENLFSPFVLQIPSGVLDQVKNFISIIYKIKESPEYLNSLDELPQGFHSWQKNPSVLTCFDFHYSEEMGLKLIEINTNASLYLPTLLQSCAQINDCLDPQFDDLLQSFVDGFSLKPGDAISIFDEDPLKEGLYFEFLIFKEWLSRKGYPTNIVSLKNFALDAKKNIYNRYTDFYLKEEKSAIVRSDYDSGNKTFSPHPREYFLLADKKRQKNLKKFLEKLNPEISSIIPESHLFGEFTSKDELWANRKKYFFKPSQSFGSKGVFSGKGISKKAFESIFSEDFMAQELCPPGKRTYNFKGEEVEMKFDLRFFTFEGRVQNYTARLYQGQATNMRTPGGGIAPIEFI